MQRTVSSHPMYTNQPSRVASNQYPSPSWVWRTLALLLLWSTLSLSALHAQGDDDRGGTIPNGTIPSEAQIYLPMIANQQPEATPTPTPIFDAIPVAGPTSDRPAAQHPDLNLAIRGYITTTAALNLVDNNGPTDTNAPQLAGIFQPARLPTFTAVYQVFDWDWSCEPDGCKSAPLAAPPVTLLALATTPGEAIHIPTRGPEIYGGGYKVMVLYADTNRITLGYTRNDTAALGYVVHMEDILVAPALLTLYQEKNRAGRGELPALRNNEPFATALGTAIKVAIRDTGMFMEPRSRKDWWMDY